MNGNDSKVRYLGAAFLTVILTSLVSGTATDQATGSGTAAQVLAQAGRHSGLLHVAGLAGLLNAVGILVLAALLHTVLQDRGRTLALVGVLCWTGEAFFYALNQFAALGLARLGSDLQVLGGTSRAASPEDLSLARFLVTDVHAPCGTILMFFYCAGGFAFYYLFFASSMVPRWLSAYGLVAVGVGLVAAGVELLGHPLGLIPYLPIGPFELVIGVYLLAKGIRTDRRPSADAMGSRGSSTSAISTPTSRTRGGS